MPSGSEIKTFASFQNFANLDGSGTSLSTCGIKVAKGVSVEQSIAKDWKPDGQISSIKGVTDFKASVQLADFGLASINASSRSRFSYNNDNSALAQRFAIGVDVPVSKNVSLYFTPNSTTNINLKNGEIAEPTLSIYSGANINFKLADKNCTLSAEVQGYDLINNPTAKAKTGVNLIFKMNF